jgi:hypothetical protein
METNRVLAASQLSESNVEHVIGSIQSLVGYFDLDPNRVLDLVLEAYEHNQENASYLRIIACFPRASLAHLTGFKFKYQYGASEDAKAPRSAAPPSQSLYLLAARLIKNKNITIEDLYPHLLPEDTLAAEEYAKRFEKTPSAPLATSTTTSTPAPGLLGIAPPGIVRVVSCAFLSALRTGLAWPLSAHHTPHHAPLCRARRCEAWTTILLRLRRPPHPPPHRVRFSSGPHFFCRRIGSLAPSVPRQHPRAPWQTRRTIRSWASWRRSWPSTTGKTPRASSTGYQRSTRPPTLRYRLSCLPWWHAIISY